MKKLNRVLLSLAVVCAVLLGFLWLEPVSAAVVIDPYGYAWTADAALTRFESGQEPQADGDWRFFVLPENHYAVIIGHNDPAAKELTIPQTLGGADVVAIAQGALSGHTALTSVTVHSNVMYMDADVFPAGLCLQGYHAAYVQQYAASQRFAFRSLSEYDFLSGVQDYTGISTDSFDRVSENLLYMRELEASRLHEGSLFFLIDPANPYAISYYEVQSISAASDGMVQLDCATPVIESVLNSYSGVNETMCVDPDTITMAEGARLLQTQSRGISIGKDDEKLTVGFEIEKKIADGQTLKFKGNLVSSHKASYSGNLFGSKKVTIDQTNEINVGVVYEVKTDQNYKHPTAEKTSYEQLKNSIDSLDSKKLIKTVKAIDIPLGRAKLFSYGGIVNAYVTWGIQWELSGEMGINLSYKVINRYEYVDGELSSSSRSSGWDLDPVLKGEASLGAYGSVVVDLLGMKLFTAKGVFGIEAAAEFLHNTHETMADNDAGFLLPINMLDTVEIKFAAFFDVIFKIGSDDLEEGSIKLRVREQEMPGITTHWHPLPGIYVPDDSADSYSFSLFKDQLHFAKNCPYDYKTVVFAFPWTSPDTVYTIDQDVLLNESIDPPEDPQLFDDYKREFVSWHTDKSLDDLSRVTIWPYKITENTTFYAKTEPYYLASFTYTDGTAVAPSDYYLFGQDIPLPESIDEREIVSWVALDDYGETLYSVPEGSTTIKMPVGGINLMALCTNDVRADFVLGVGNMTTTVYGGRGMSMNAPDAGSISRPRYDFVGWTDADGNSVTFPIALNKDTPDHLLFYSQWEYNGEITADNLDSSYMGTAIGTSGAVQSGASFFTYEPYEHAYAWETITEARITGYKSRQPVTTEDGSIAYVTIDPVNLIIPSEINGMKVTAVSSYAFDKLETLRSIEFPFTICDIGTYAVADCPNLEVITVDAGNIMLDELPSRFASNCPSLKCVLLPTSVRKLGSYAFSGCTALTEVVIGAEIGAGAFYGCTALSSVKLGYGTTSIGAYAFENCTSLTSFTVPDCAASVGNFFLRGCVNLTTLTFDGAPTVLTENIMTIGKGSLLTTLKLGEGIIALEASAFDNDGNGFPLIKEIILPTTLNSLGNLALAGTSVEKLEIYSPNVIITGSILGSCPSLREVTILGGTLKSSTFSGCENLEKVTIGEGVRSIGAYAFRNCKKLHTIVIRDGLTSIGNYAFAGCTSLETLVFPDSVTSYGARMIEGCTGLKSLTIGGGCAELKQDSSAYTGSYSAAPFYIGEGATLRELHIREGVTSIDDYLFLNSSWSNDADYSFGYPTLESVSLPESLQKIGRYAFSRSGIRELTISSNVTLIDACAFYNCSNLTSVTFKNSPALIGSSAFSSCTSLTSVDLGDSITTIYSYAFSNCTSLTALSFPDSVTSYGARMLQGCTGLKSLTIGGGCTELTTGGSMSNNDSSWKSPFYIGPNASLRELHIREGVTSLGSYVFANGISSYGEDKMFYFPTLEVITLPESLESIGYYAFYHCGVKHLSLSGSLKLIDQYAFSGASKLETLSIDGSGLTIGYNAFYGASSLRKLTLGSGVSSIYGSVFRNAVALTDVDLGSGIRSIGQNAFSGCTSLETLVFPDSVTSYGARMIEGCTGLKSLTIGGGCAELKQDSSAYTGSYSAAPFYIGEGATLRELHIREGVTSIDNYLFLNSSWSNDAKYALGYPTLESVSLPESLQNIGYYAFSGSGIRELVFGSNVTSINFCAFNNSPNLTSVTFKNSPASIGSSAFANCTSLTSVELGDSITSIGGSTFSGCTSLPSLSFPDSVTSYGARMIQGCTGLKSLTIGGGCTELTTGGSMSNNDYTWKSPFYIGPNASLRELHIREGVTSLGSYVFANSILYYGEDKMFYFPTLEVITLPESLISIGDSAFYNCGVKHLSLSGNLKLIDQRAFYGASKLETLSIDGSDLTISHYAFCGASSLRKLTLGSGVSSMYNGAFQKCTSLTDVNLGNGIRSIGQYAFSGCTSLETLVFPDSVTSYGARMIEGCTGLKSLTIGGGCAELNVNHSSYTGSDYAAPFYIGEGATLRELHIREGVTSIGNYVFGNCIASSGEDKVFYFPTLEAVTLPDSLQSIGWYAFEHSGICALTIGPNVTSIGPGAFSNCTELTSVTFNDSPSVLVSFTFSGCTNLTTVDLGQSITSIGNAAFQNCSSLTALSFPDSVTSYGTNLIWGCTSLTDLVVGGGCPVFNSTTSFSIGADSQLTRLVVREGVKEIRYTFVNASSISMSNALGFDHLTSVIMPESLTVLTKNELQRWPNLQHLYLGSQTDLSSFAYWNYAANLPNLTIYSDVYSDKIMSCATTYGATYVVKDMSTFPQFSFTRMMNIPDGDSPSTLLSQEQVYYGASLPEFETPEVEGFVFGGWYQDEDFTTVWTQNTMPSGELTLWARMLPIHDVLFALEEGGIPDDRLPDGFTLYAEAECAYTQAITAPGVTVSGRAFGGWYKDADFTESWSAATDTMPDGTLILYGQLVPQRLVTFAVNLPGDTLWQDAAALPEGFSVYTTLLATAGHEFPLPEEPVTEGYVFGGWYTDPDFICQWSHQPLSDMDLVLYGRMIKARAGALYTLTDDGYRLDQYTLEQDESTEVFLPAKYNGIPVTSIADYAFRDSGITRLHLPENLQTIGSKAFLDADTLAEVTISTSNQHFRSIDGVLYSRDKTVLYHYPAAKQSRQYTLPAGVVSIAPYAFADNPVLTSLTLPEGLVTIGENAMQGMKSLTALVLPDSTTTLGANALSYCPNLTSLTAFGLTSIGENAIPANDELIIRGPLGQGALRSYCISELDGSSFMSISYNLQPLSLYIDGELFGVMNTEAGVLLPGELSYGATDDGQLILGWYRDEGCTESWDFSSDLMPNEPLTLYTHKSSLFGYEEHAFSITETAEDGTEITSVITGILLTAYRGEESELTIPATINGLPVMGLGDTFLASARVTVTRVSIGSSVIQIADTALHSADGTAFTGTIAADENSFAAQWAAQMGYACSLRQYQLSFVTYAAAIADMQATAGTAIRLGSPVRGEDTFLGWFTDEALTLPVPLDENGLFIMPADSLTLYAAWNVPAAALPFTFMENEQGITITGYTGTSPLVEVPANILGMPVTEIASGAFRQAASITRIVLPDSVTNVGSEAFAYSGLVTADLGGTQFLGAYAFEGCQSLASLTMEHLTEAGASAWQNCTALRSVTLPDSLVSLGESAFGGCSSLGSIVLPDALSSLPAYAFHNCQSLKQVTLGTSLRNMDGTAFIGCANLRAFAVSAENTAFTVNDGLLLSAEGDRVIRMPQGCGAVSCALPDTVTTIAPYAFASVESLTSITFPASLTELGTNAFSGSGVTGIDLTGTRVTTIPANAFRSCMSLRSVRLGAAVESIDSGAFSGCTNLTEITIPASVTSIHTMSFSPSDTLIITGTSGSTAHTFAKANDFMFSDPDAEEITEISMIASTLVMQRGDVQQLEVSIQPAEASKEIPLFWSSSNPDAALVDNGFISAIGGGSTVITVRTGNGVTASITLEVQVAVESLSILGAPTVMYRGETAALMTAILPLTATEREIVWESSQPAVLAVDENGLVTALSAGTAQVIATAHNGIVATAEISVVHRVEAIELAADNTLLYLIDGMNQTALDAAILPADASNPDIHWSSSDNSIATVDESGLVTAVSTGEVIIRAEAADGYGAYAEITITVSLRDISALTPPELDCTHVYDGTSYIPPFALTIDDRLLTEGRDYTVSVDDSIHAGEHTLTITGTGSYSGMITAAYTILQATPEITYTGRYAFELDSITPTWTHSELFESTSRYVHIAEDGTRTDVEGLPTIEGDYDLIITIPESADNTAAETTVRIRIAVQLTDALSPSADGFTLQPGQAVRLCITCTPADMAVPSLQWNSSDETVLTVDDTGLITALSEGTAQLTVTALDGSEVSASVSVTVAALRTMTLPAQLTAIEDEAFTGLPLVEAVVAGNDLAQIGNHAFAGMTALRQAVLPASVQSIAEDAFADCTALVILCTEGSEAETFALQHNLPCLLLP